MLLFTYGSLKFGFARNDVLSNQRYLGTANTAPKYGMYQYSSYPALVDKYLAELSGVIAESSVYGELYEVNSDCMHAVDLIEGCDQGFFERKLVELDEITLVRLPKFNLTWGQIEGKNAECYFFKRKLTGAANCGSFWGQK